MLLYSPEGHQDVPGSAFELLVAMHEARDLLVCREVLDLLEGQSRASEAAWQVAASGGSHVEMGTNQDGFYHQVAKDGEGLRRYLGHRGSTDQERPLFSDMREFIGREVGQSIYPRDRCSPWSTGLYRFRP